MRAARAEEEEEDEEEDEEADEEQRTRWQHSRAKTGGLKLHWRKIKRTSAAQTWPLCTFATITGHWTPPLNSALVAQTWPHCTFAATITGHWTRTQVGLRREGLRQGLPINAILASHL